MKKTVNSNIYKILIPMLIVWSVIVIFKAGIAFGGWLFAMLH